MPGYVAYWDGLELAQIEPIEHSVIGQHEQDATKAVNLAFLVYYQGVRFANAVGAADPKVGRQVKEDLRAAALSGWGFGVHDLDDAFKHVAANNGRWTDDETRFYRGAMGTYSGWIPLAAANFFTAIDAKLAEAKALAEKQQAATGKLNDAVAGEPAWKTAREALAELKACNETMNRYLWLVPAGLSGATSLMPMAWRMDTVAGLLEEGNEVAEKWVKAYDVVDGAVQTFDTLLTQGLPQGPAALIAVLEQVAAYLPFFGDVYGKAITLLPAVMGIFQSIAETRQQQMLHALYDAGRGQQFQHMGSTR